MAGMHQPYSCRNCGYQGSAEVPANAADEVLYEAAEADHAEHSPDCAAPGIELDASASG
jgi:hypothetical protein